MARDIRKIVEWLKVSCWKAVVCIVHCVMHSFNNDTYLSIKSLGSNWMFSLIVLTNYLIVLDKVCNFWDSTHYISQSSIWFVGAFNRETKEIPMTVCLDCFSFYIFYLLCATTFISEYIVGFITDLTLKIWRVSECLL